MQLSTRFFSKKSTENFPEGYDSAIWWFHRAQYAMATRTRGGELWSAEGSTVFEGKQLKCMTSMMT